MLGIRCEGGGGGRQIYFKLILGFCIKNIFSLEIGQLFLLIISPERKKRTDN